MRQYVVDAFTDRIFCGNPAAVCIMDSWLPDELMQAIAIENGLSETAFAVPLAPPDEDVPGAAAAGCVGSSRDAGSERVPRYRLHWFTPGGEIDLCGHATLATAFVLMSFYLPAGTRRVEFSTMGGELAVERVGDLFELDFPAYDMRAVPVTNEMRDALGCEPVEAFMGRDLLCVLPSAQDVVGLSPDMEKVSKLEGLGLHVTACAEGKDTATSIGAAVGEDPVAGPTPGPVSGPATDSTASLVSGPATDSTASPDIDCVSRSFFPKLDVPEDPVCGSGHCHIVPFWAKRLGKERITARQASRRGGTLYCRVEGNRVKLAGNAVLFSEAEIHIG